MASIADNEDIAAIDDIISGWFLWMRHTLGKVKKMRLINAAKHLEKKCEEFADFLENYPGEPDARLRFVTETNELKDEFREIAFPGV